MQRDTDTHPFLCQYPMDRVIAAYPLGLIRLYCHIRSHILRNHILAEIGQYLPLRGEVCELGCGFGLFATNFALARPDLRFHGIDLNAGRIARAQQAAAKCGASNVTFHAEDARTALEGLTPQDCIYMLDLVHHLPPDSVEKFLGEVWGLLRPGGTLVIKDVSDRPWYKMAFTWILDVLMTRGEIPNYLSPARFLALLEGLGAEVVVHRMNDYLPYPHILYVCRKPPAT